MDNRFQKRRLSSRQRSICGLHVPCNFMVKWDGVIKYIVNKEPIHDSRAKHYVI